VTEEQTIKALDILITQHPELVLKPDPELIKLADSLIEGVEVNQI